MSHIVKFMERFHKAKADNPFPWDRVFPSNEELRDFGDELIAFCEGYAEAVEENQRLRAMLEAQETHNTP